MERGSFLVAICVLMTSTAWAQESSKHECHVFVADFANTLAALKENQAPPPGADTTLGRFQPALDLNKPTTQWYSWPGRDLVISATVLYTQRSLPLSKYAMTLAIAVAKGPVPNALADNGAAVAAVSLEPDTFIVSVRQRLLLGGKPWVVGLQCQTRTDEARKRQLEEYQEREQ
jgi:hypothetical protein